MPKDIDSKVKNGDVEENMPKKSDMKDASGPKNFKSDFANGEDVDTQRLEEDYADKNENSERILDSAPKTALKDGKFPR